MTDFQLQQGVVDFELPVVVPDFLTQIQTINQNIITQAQASGFNYVYPTLAYLPNQQIPDQVYALLTHFMKRGFVAQYDGEEATLTVAWDHPEMSDTLFSQISYASPSVLPTLGGWFEAGVVYLCETGGVDLRAQSIVTVKRNIQFAVENAALMGLTSTAWGFPLVPSGVINNLYADVFSELYDDGFGVTYNAVTGLYVIAWDDQTIAPALFVGDETSVQLETFPNGTSELDHIYYEGSSLTVEGISTTAILDLVAYEGSEMDTVLDTSGGTPPPDRPASDVVVTNQWSTSAISTPLAISTTSNDNLLLAIVVNETTGESDPPPAITTAINADGLTFTKYATYNANLESATHNIDIWYTVLTGVVNTSVTVTTNIPVDDAGLILVSVAGANTSTPFYDGGSTGLFGTGVAGNSIQAITDNITANANQLLFCVQGQATNIVPTAPTGFTTIATIDNSGGALYEYASVSTLTVPSGFSQTISSVNLNPETANGMLVFCLA